MWIAEMTGDGDGQAIFQSRSLSWPHQQPAEALVHWGSSGAWVGSVSHKHHHSAEFGLGRQRGGGVGRAQLTGAAAGRSSATDEPRLFGLARGSGVPSLVQPASQRVQLQQSQHKRKQL
jgi:hypothetical protein